MTFGLVLSKAARAYRAAEQRETLQRLRAAFRLHFLEEFSFGALHGDSGFGVRLRLRNAIQFRQAHLGL